MNVFQLGIMLLIPILILLYIVVNVMSCQDNFFLMGGYSITRWDWNEMACYSTAFYGDNQLTTWKSDIWFNMRGYLSKEEQIKQIEFNLYTLPVEYYDFKNSRVASIPEEEVTSIHCDAVKEMFKGYGLFAPFECGGKNYTAICKDMYCREFEGWKISD